MRERYEEELRKLNTSIINMGKMIEIAIESSMLALMGRDVEAAKQVAKNESGRTNNTTRKTLREVF